MPTARDTQIERAADSLHKRGHSVVSELNRGARRLRPLGVGTGRRSIAARRHGKRIHTRAQKRQQVIKCCMSAFAQSQNKDAPQMLGRVFLTFDQHGRSFQENLHALRHRHKGLGEVDREADCR